MTANWLVQRRRPESGWSPHPEVDKLTLADHYSAITWRHTPSKQHIAVTHRSRTGGRVWPQKFGSAALSTATVAVHARKSGDCGRRAAWAGESVEDEPPCPVFAAHGTAPNDMRMPAPTPRTHPRSHGSDRE